MPLGPLTIPQLLLSIAVFGGAIAGAYYGAGVLRQPDGAAAQANEQLVTAAIGDLVKQVTIGGTTAFRVREWQTFDGAGVVGEVRAAKGDEVKAGQVIAVLDEASSAARKRAFAAAEVALRDAEDALAKLSDQTGVLADATKKHDAARSVLENAQADLAVKRAYWARKLSAREKAFTDARGAYASAYRSWLGIALTVDQVDERPADLLASWGIGLAALFRAAPSVHAVDGSLPDDHPATVWNERIVALWTSLYPARVTGTCERAPANLDRCVRSELDAAWNALRVAAEALASDRAQADVALFAAKQAVDDAEGALAGIAEEVAKAESGQDALAVRLAQADVEVARIEVEIRAARAEGSTLAASIPGFVSEVVLKAGDHLGENRRVLEIVDPRMVEVQGSADEVDVLSIQVGAQAEVSMDALAGRSLSGRIDSIGSGSGNQLGVVTYPVAVVLDVPADVNLVEGLSAIARVVVSETRNVLLIPTAAVGGSFLQPTVRVAKGGAVEERPVTLGDSDDFWVAVTSGLEEGEQVLMSVPERGGFLGFRPSAPFGN